MPRWKSVLSLLLIVASPCCAAAGLDIALARIQQTGSHSVLDAELRIDFPEPILDALGSGVPLTLEFSLEILRPERWWLDSTLYENSWMRQIRYYSLSRQYVVLDEESETSVSMPWRDQALLSLGTLTGRRLEFASDEAVNYRLRCRLDLSSLPAPMRLPAWLSSDWRLASEWYTWQSQ